MHHIYHPTIYIYIYIFDISHSMIQISELEKDIQLSVSNN